MKKSHRVLISAAVLLLAIIGFSRAQAVPVLEHLDIVFWPEYDQPAVLVMLRAWLPADVPLPAYVPIPIPAGVTPSAVAKRDASGALLLAAHTVIDRRSYQEVRVMADTPEIRVEYYAPLTLSGADRSYLFSWPGGLTLDTVQYQVQLPVGATELSITPPAQQESTGFDGLSYFSADLGRKPAAEVFEIRFDYSKTSVGLTQSALQKGSPATTETVGRPSEPVEQAAESEPASGGYDNSFQCRETWDLPWLVVIPVVLIAALLVVWFRLSGADS